MAEQQLEQIEGTVEDIIYENTDNGYMVFEVSGGGVVTVVCGIVGELHAGESVVCRGRYENHATYGRQFHAQGVPGCSRRKLPARGLLYSPNSKKAPLCRRACEHSLSSVST